MRDRVSQVIESFRPFIQADGGDIELVDVRDDGSVAVRLKGACVGCPMSAMTLKAGVERHLRERIPEVTEVINVT
ncbi:MAG: NifU family protein [Planctomycetes bacterium]|nr:NifU family protein [Planctomycetota bacterium]